MFFSAEQIYLWIGLLVLGLGDLYLYRFPLFHPIVLIPIAGWVWGDFSNSLVVGGMLELVFGLAHFKETGKLNMILYAGGLALWINQQTNNMTLVLSLTIALVLALGVQTVLAKVRDWQKWVIILIISGLVVLLMPFGRQMFGWIPAQLLNQMAVAAGILPWIFFAYALVGMFGRDRITELAIPAVVVGSILCMRGYFWGPIAFVILFYLLDTLLKDQDWHFLWWINWTLLLLGIYQLLPNLYPTTLWVFGGVLVFNMLLAKRGFVPLEIYLLNLIAGIILCRGGLLV